MADLVREPVALLGCILEPLDGGIEVVRLPLKVKTWTVNIEEIQAASLSRFHVNQTQPSPALSSWSKHSGGQCMGWLGSIPGGCVPNQTVLSSGITESGLF